MSDNINQASIFPEMWQVNFFGLTPGSVAERASGSAAETSFSLKRSLLHGSFGLGLASTVVFAIVRCGSFWMHQYFGLLGPYLIATALLCFWPAES
jgi:hypothetical protein